MTLQLKFQKTSDLLFKNYKSTIRLIICGFFLLGGFSLSAQNTFPSSGNVGIGTTLPAYDLTVEGTTYSNDIKTKSLLYETLHSSYPEGVHRSHFNQWNRLSLGLLTTGNYFSIEDWTSGPSSLKYLLSVKLDGNVGIGTLTPQEKLQIYDDKDGPVYLGIYNNNLGSNSVAGIKLGMGNNYDKGTTIYFKKADNTFYLSNTGDPNSKFAFVVRKSDGTFITPFKINSNGNIGIGTTSPDSKLTVKGKIHAEEVKVDLSVPGPDYVFANDYKLPTLEALQHYIQENKHLPNIPSAKEMEANGIELGIMNMKLLEKIEELTLYTLEQEKEIKKIKILEEKLKIQEKLLKRLINSNKK